MKIFLISILFLLIGGFGQINAQNKCDTIFSRNGTDSIIRETIYIRDTIFVEVPIEEDEFVPPADIIRTKAVGRYDRGIINYRFIPRKKWIGGLTISYLDFDTKDSRLLYSLFKDMDSHARTLSIKPFMGYAYKDNVVIGAKFGYSHTIVQLDNLALNVEDLDFSLKDIRYSEDGYTLALFHRSYVGLDAARRFGLFNEVTLSFNMASSRFTRDRDEAFKRTDTNIYELHLGVSPGIAVFIMDNVSAEMSFGVVGFKYRTETQKNNLGETGKRNSSGANFKINLFNINIGVTLCI